MNRFTGKTDAVRRTAEPGGRLLAAPAREHGASRGAVHTVVAGHEDAPAPELPVALDMPGAVAGLLRTAGPSPSNGPNRPRSPAA
ncbi:hypothetical protein [Streptomyces sp. 147326]|uniref:hypothetical protein n=1 Tax=Streptomyces sp. 147326 TaxID=3074379 RepID=UPI003857D264